MPSPELKEKLLTMMKWFHEYCVDNDIRYYAIGGTLLGAVRHQGFIPWDDDIDIGVPRADFERLIKQIGDRQTGKYYLESPYSPAPDYVFPRAKLYDTSTTLIENLRTPLKRGVFIDIFPLDGIGNTEREAKRNARKINFLMNVHAACTGKLRKGRNHLKNLLFILGKPISVFLNGKDISALLTRVFKTNDFDMAEFGGNLGGRYRTKEIVRRTVFGKPTLYPFEDTKIYGVQNYDEYLTLVYGNWHEIPKRKNQTQDHDVLYENLFESYLSKDS